MLSSEDIKKYAIEELGIDQVGIASIDRFKSAPAYMDPKTIMPDAKSLIVFTRRIPRGCYRGIEQGTHWPSYQVFGYAGLTRMIHQGNYLLGRFIEDRGFEAVPVPPAATLKEAGPRGPVSEGGKYPRNINISARIAAVLAGIGEMGWSKVLLTKKFGPRQRLGMILTDAELTPDPIQTAEICDGCMLCAGDCPAGAISRKQGVEFETTECSWKCNDLDLGKCKLTHFGLNRATSPHFVKHFPGIYIPIAEQGATWVEGWNLGYAVFSGIPTYKAFSSYPIAICGARGCIMSCMSHLEKTKRVDNIFKEKPVFSDKKPWRLPEKPPKYHQDHHGFAYDPDNDHTSNQGIQSDWY
jgi:ferredoxin